jgi:hypothetical protein
MVKTHFLFCFLILALVLSSCSIEVDQPSAATPPPAFESVPTVSPSTESVPQTNVVAKTQIPVTWGELNLTGSLVYINGISVDNVFELQIQVLDLVTGELTTIFDAPKYSWIYYISVSPDHTQLVMSYNPPPGDNPVDQDIYIMPLDGSRAPQRLFTPPTRRMTTSKWNGRQTASTFMLPRHYCIPPAEGDLSLCSLPQNFQMAGGDDRGKAITRVSPTISSAYVSVDLFSRGNKYRGGCRWKQCKGSRDPSHASRISRTPVHC